MGALLGFFNASPARVQLLLIGALAAIATCASLLVFGLYWRGEAYQARGERDVAIAQATALAASIRACSASVAAAERAAESAVATTRGLLDEAKRLAQPAAAEIRRLEDLLKRKPPARADGKPAGCDDAWQEIEKG